MQKSYIAIDLKSFYASVECVERGLDPLTTNLVVADESRTEKTICLAVSPSLKAHGLPGRARLYEVNQSGLDFIIAKPRMAYYMRYSARIYSIYLRFVSPEDIFAYSIDEVFIDATPYLKMYKMSARELAEKIIKTIYDETGITATAGIGTNLYLAKVAMDIIAKHKEPNQEGARIGELDEITYRKILWNHQPLTDFWRIGHGYAKKLESVGLRTMGDIALCSEKDEDFLYKLFGINAELLIDHAWGYEPCEIKDVKKYQPKNNSLSSGQVLKEPYNFVRARTIVAEMAEEMALSLLSKNLVTDQITLTINYDKISLKHYDGKITKDFYGRSVPKPAHGTRNLTTFTSSAHLIKDATLNLFDRHVQKDLFIRRITINANHVFSETANRPLKQTSLFEQPVNLNLDKEKRVSRAILKIKQKYGKNSILKGINFEAGATGRERNSQIGGHQA